MSRCRIRRQYFVTSLNKLDLVADLVEGAEQRVDAVPRVTVDAFYRYSVRRFSINCATFLVMSNPLYSLVGYDTQQLVLNPV